MTSDSGDPVQRLSSRPTSGREEGFFDAGCFSTPRLRSKSNPRSLEYCSSVNLAGEAAVQIVAELPLLSEELDD